MTDDNIAVVKPYYAIERAYQMGYDRFADMEPPEDGDPEIHHFHDSAEYANTVLPRLRAMAGYDDAGHGTYQRERQVAAVEPGAEEDTPAEAALVDAHTVFETLSDAWHEGAHDGALNEKKDDPATVW